MSDVKRRKAKGFGKNTIDDERDLVFFESLLVEANPSKVKAWGRNYGKKYGAKRLERFLIKFQSHKPELFSAYIKDFVDPELAAKPYL